MTTQEKLTVRLVNDTKNGRFWFEEKLKNNQWSKIPETDMACEANARYELSAAIEARRQQRLAIFRRLGPEETFQIL